MRKLLLILICFLCFASNTSAQNQIEKSSKKLTQQLNNWHNLESGLWDTTSWWNSANVLTAMIKNAQLRGDMTYKETVAFVYEKTKEFTVEANEEKDAWVCKNYINEYYDDEGWWALAWLDAWEYTGEQKYLEMANVIFEDITQGWTKDGGLYWKKGLTYRASISNGLTLTLSTRLHLAGTKDVNGKSALEWATAIWKWMMDSQLINTDGNIQDGIRSKDGVFSISERVFTYNQGVVLTGLVNLHEITKKQSYLMAAHDLAEATMNHLSSEDLVLTEINCEPNDCNADAKQFKGVFMRHLMYLNTHYPKEEYRFFILKNVKAIWEGAMLNGTVQPGVRWNHPSEPNAATVSSALDAFNAGISLPSKK